MATCFEFTESSSGLIKEQIQCIKIYSAFWDPKCLLTIGSAVDTIIYVSET